MWVLGSKKGLKGKKWTEKGDKNTQSDFFQYMRTLNATKFTKWFVTLRYDTENVQKSPFLAIFVYSACHYTPGECPIFEKCS